MRLIDADACIDDIRNNNQQAWEALAYAPTIDAVEVIRCKECKHRHELECPMYHEEWFTIDEGDGWCDSDFRIIDETQDDGFCDCGEREEE